METSAFNQYSIAFLLLSPVLAFFTAINKSDWYREVAEKLVRTWGQIDGNAEIRLSEHPCIRVISNRPLSNYTVRDISERLSRNSFLAQAAYGE